MFGFARKLAKKAEGFIAPGIDENGPTYGFRVVYVEPDSEAFHAGLEPLFDFIVAVNGQRFDQRYYDTQDESPQPPNIPGLSNLVSVEQEQSPFQDFELAVDSTQERLVLEVWSAKGKTARTVLLPNPAKQANGLGFDAQWYPLSVADQVWHILNVVPRSPAASAGLVSHADYIVAAQNGELEAAAMTSGEHALSRLVFEARGSREGVLFYVYNREYDVVRPVRVIPTPDGKLGCGVGYGLLHALPKVSGTSGSLLFDGDKDLFSPAQNVPAPEAPSETPAVPLAGSAYAPHRHKPHRSAQSAGLSDYFEEQSRISHEIDGSTAKKAVPPPPKAH